MTAKPGHASTSDLAPGAAPHGYADHKGDHLARLHKVEGQVRGIARMVEDDRYCIDVLTQISAVNRALQEVALGLLDDHVRHCVTDAARSNPAEGEAKLAELALALRRTLRL
ncbi:metal-sensitive transcriptional regulator [Streptomyces sp. NPDC054835]